jgi:hypothetical protein
MFDGYEAFAQQHQGMTEEELNRLYPNGLPLQPMSPLPAVPPGMSVLPPPGGMSLPETWGTPVTPPADTPPGQSPYLNPNAPMQEASMGGGSNFLDKLFGGSGGTDTLVGGAESGGGLLGGNKDWGSMLMALGGGIAQGAQFGGGGWGGGLGAGFQGAAAANMRNKQLNQQQAQFDAEQARALEVAKMRAQGEDQYFGTPVPFQRQDGTWGVGLPSKDGGFKELNMGEGNAYYPPTNQIDTATGTQNVTRHGAVPIGPEIKKNLAKAEQEKVEGKGQGDAAESLTSMRSKLPGLQAVVSKLDTLAETATYTTAGQAYNTVKKELGLGSTEGGVARAEYIAIVDNQVLPLLRDTFGAQFTVQEGESLRATLGDPDKTPQEKQAVLKSFIAQKARDIEALESRTGQQPTGSGAPIYKKYNPKTGKIE